MFGLLKVEIPWRVFDSSTSKTNRLSVMPEELVAVLSKPSPTLIISGSLRCSSIVLKGLRASMVRRLLWSAYVSRLRDREIDCVLQNLWTRTNYVLRSCILSLTCLPSFVFCWSILSKESHFQNTCSRCIGFMQSSILLFRRKYSPNGQGSASATSCPTSRTLIASIVESVRQVEYYISYETAAQSMTLCTNYSCRAFRTQDQAPLWILSEFSLWLGSQRGHSRWRGSTWLFAGRLTQT